MERKFLLKKRWNRCKQLLGPEQNRKIGVVFLWKLLGVYVRHIINVSFSLRPIVKLMLIIYGMPLQRINILQ